ncbi:MAG: hypothetical protein HPY68_09130, partial [Candidatus Atribacteria bacterium]|nr:hypothetical protein [Candidatus Atribacteria bacterium]
MSLGDAFRKLGHIEAVRSYAEDAPGIVGNYASEAFAEVGDALEHYMNSRIYGALEQMEEEEALLREEMVRAIRKA